MTDTDDDAGITAATIEQYDAVFDQLAEAGIPVDDLLATNSNFVFAGGWNDGITPDVLFENVIEFFTPDIEAYQAGETPEDKTIIVSPTDNPADPNELHGRDAYEMEDGGSGRYQVTIETVSGTSSDTSSTGESTDGGPSDLAYTYTLNEDGTYTDEEGNIVAAEDLPLAEFDLLGSSDTATGGTETEDGTEDGTDIDMSGRSDVFWTEFANKWFDDENNAALLFDTHADHMADAAQKNTDTVNSATSTQSDNISDAIDTYYSDPITLDWFGTDITFVPKGSLATASSLASLTQSDMDNKIQAANNELNNASTTSPAAGDLAYLDALGSILGSETARNNEISDAEYKALMALVAQQNANSNSQNADSNSQKVDQNEPGILDYVGEGVDIISGIDTAWDFLNGIFDF